MSLNTNPATKKPTPSGTTDSPYLGSKISLVSKAKIRYEGILYTIDANESTVALSKVRSFGTEDRPTDRPVPPRDEIFEYIIFRGADIEDLQVREPPQTSLPQDPAIVESSMYPSAGRSAGSATLSGPGASNSNNLSSPLVPTGSNKSAKPSSNNDPLRQLNTQPTSRSFYQQREQQQGDGQDYSYGNQRRSGRQQQDYYNDQRRTGSGKYGYDEWPRTNNSAWENNNYRQPQSQQQQRYPRQQQQQQQQNYDNNRFYPNRRQQQQQQQQQQSNGGYQGGNRERRNSTGGMTGNQQRNHRQRADSTRGNANNQSALKFIGDFDFEKSNAEFDKNAIEDEIKKSLSIKTSKDKTEESTPTEQQQQKENVPAEQNPAPVQPTSSSTAEKNDRPDQEANADGFYDKQRSFFDRISCETTEKEKTSNARRNWNEERRLNAETFGLRYRPAQQGGNQRHPGGYNNYNNQRRGYSGGGGGQQQSFYGNGARYQRGGGGGGGGGGQQRGRNNNTYYNNSNNNNNNRMRAY